MNNSNTEQCEHENQNRKDSDPTEQANPNVTIYIHAAENEAEDVRGTVLCEENDDPGERYSPVDRRESIVHFKEEGIKNVQIVARHDQRGQGYRRPHQNPNHQGQGGYGQQQGGYGQQQDGYGQQQGGYGQQQGENNAPPQDQGTQEQQNQSQRIPTIERRWSSTPSGVPMPKPLRGPFMRKVLTMLFVCSAFTTACATICTYVLIVISMLIPFVMLFFPCTRRAPCSYILLILAVIAESIMFGFVASFVQTVLLAMASTNIVVLVCLGLTFTRVDFTKRYMFILVTVLTVVVFCPGFAVWNLVLRIEYPLFLFLIILTFCVYQSLVYIMHIQMMLEGRTLELGLDQWLIGTFILYTSTMTTCVRIALRKRFSGRSTLRDPCYR